MSVDSHSHEFASSVDEAQLTLSTEPSVDLLPTDLSPAELSPTELLPTELSPTELFDEADLDEHESDEFVEEDLDLEEDLNNLPHLSLDIDDDDDLDDDDLDADLEAELEGDLVAATDLVDLSDDAVRVDTTPSWQALGVAPDLARALEAEGITTPFPIQIATLPEALAGKDICGEAPTGSGKTLAYGIAAVSVIGEVRSRRPHALILVPVRELAEQTSRALQPISKPRRVWVQTCVGGTDINRQANALRKGAGIVVATPGRLIDLLSHGDVSFEDLRLVVIDEADRMADMGFLPQVEQILEGSTERAERAQVLLFSATLDGDVGELIRRYQQDPVRHSTKGVGLVSEHDHVDTVGDHLRVLVRHENKLDIAAAIAEPARRSLVFVKNRFASERVAQAISERGVPAAHLHGGLTQGARNRVIMDWAAGKVRTVVATDMVARGLHMDHVDVVIHLDAPQDEKDYIHRSGRTGRAGAAGTVVNLMRKEQRRFFDGLERRLGVTSREALLDEVIGRLREQVIASKAAPVSGKGATPLPTVEGVYEEDSFQGRSERGGDRGRPSFGDRDRGGRGSYGDRDRGPRPSFGGDRGGDRGRPSFGGSRGGFGDRDRGADRGPRAGGGRPDRPWVPQEEWEAKLAADREARGDRPWIPQEEFNAMRAAEREARGERPWVPQEEWEAKRSSERGASGRPDRPWVPQEEWDAQRAARGPRPGGDRDRGDRGGFGDRDRGGDRGGDRGPRGGGFGDRDRGPRSFDRGGDRPGGDRPGGDRGGFGGPRGGFGDRDRGPRPGGDRPGGRPDRPWVPQEEWDAQRAARGPRPGGDRGGFGGPRGGFGDRDRGADRGADRGPRSFDRDRGGDRPGFGGPRGGFGDRDRGADRGADRGPRSFDRDRGPRPGGDRPGGDRPGGRDGAPRDGGWDRPRRDDGGGFRGGPRPGADRGGERGGFGGRPSGPRPGADRGDRGGFGGRPSGPRGDRDDRGGRDGDRPATNGYIPRGVKMWQAGRRNNPKP
jgi:superfamily II DNA/RNA helicase